MLGLVLGVRHATDPDHVVAVATIVSRERSVWAAALIGGLWGIGHSVTVTLVGGLIILFDVVIPPRLGLAMEFSVALMLVALGAFNLLGLRQRVTAALGTAPGAGVHAHPHSHHDYVHSHPHGHAPEAHGHAEDATPLSWLDAVLGRLGVYQAVRPLVVGLVHGLAGSAAVALLVLATIRDARWAAAYLLLFGAGTVVGMMAMTAAIGLPIAHTARRSARVHRYLGLASGALSLAFGLFLAYQIGLVDGLFTGAPHWDPR